MHDAGLANQLSEGINEGGVFEGWRKVESVLFLDQRGGGKLYTLI